VVGTKMQPLQSVVQENVEVNKPLYSLIYWV